MPEASQHPPRAATEFLPETLTLSPKQALVLRTLREFPHGASAAELADRLGMHSNTVRGHLEELLAHQAVSQHTAPAQGRGRPTLIFQAKIPDTRAVAQEYLTLIKHLAPAIEPDQAHEIGRRWAQSEGSGTVEELMEKLQKLGFDPELRERDHAIDLRACPFVRESTPPHPSVCGMHEGFFQEFLSAPDSTRVIPLRTNCRCTIVFDDDSA
ncbi:helix-turn-helix domain-containing protein [Corynebacterium sp. zg-331]|uniref:helix-turn-helix transcriptional regulator n=1 Tax=unclassified Corynebacterium TaxID=2624378 RepID=UPI00128E5130|nr:helix-turn-helix domain-containing protein [Corynebacterium sp. zg-331]MPV52681.1 helix-turn-helix domain-containing protein [Corynebacterium sp. zg331]